MKKIAIFILLMMIPVAFALEECKRVIEDPGRDIPCRVTTTWQPTPPCTGYQAIIFNGSGVNLSTHNLTRLGNSSFCYFTFNITDQGDYPYNISTGDTGNILVKADNMWLIAILLIPLGVAFFFAYYSEKFKEDVPIIMWFFRLLSLTSLPAVYIGANIIVNTDGSYPGLIDLFNMPVITNILRGVFALLFVYIVWQMYKAWKNAQRANFEEGLL